MRKFALNIVLFYVIVVLCTGCGQGTGAKVTSQLELAVKYLSESKFEEAILAYKEVIKIDPKNVMAYKAMGVAYAMQGKTDLAEGSLQEGIKKASDSRPIKLALAGLFYDLGKKGQTEAIYKEIIAQDGKYLPAYQAFSRFLIAEDRRDGAVTLIENATGASPNQYQLYTMLAETHIKGGHRDKALEAIGKSLSIEPNQSGAYRLLDALYPGI